MDPDRNQAYNLLEAFIQSQKALLARTCSDVERLRRLRDSVVDDPKSTLPQLLEDKSPAPFADLGNPSDCVLEIPETLNWSLFNFHDPDPLHRIASTARAAASCRDQPSTKQQSELSDLQKFVKEARRTILDPVLSQYACQSSDTEEEMQLSPEELQREREREKIRELKKWKIRPYGKKPPGRGLAGVFIRHDVEDESQDVDISYEGTAMAGSQSWSKPMDMDIPATSLPRATPPSSPLSDQRLRARRPTVKRAEASQVVSRSRRKASEPILPPRAPTPISEDIPAVPKPKDGGKPKPETYKQAWSVSEQNLLEHLLEQIPDGEKNRWLKISRAMNGRRTPRQVASRVQKYFEKLKRFGIDVGGGPDG
ncbi:hypothetical protein BDN72DRAFT_871067 [Pluteus cervinus]|uniref:Uncharacterized protein n=1 Tax=Pluteus cervinus TaxID=181527 RepID=A0ACD3ARM0_9AGAR|nr:hypothetical protein BDN72DRAFT_871067 [Pluteus cervinus]